tara:strand:- start:64 stop:1905 length:1842 start_codon:yes stop_codon:yes gene_type:complete
MNEEEELQKALEEENKRAQKEYDEITKGNQTIRKKQQEDQQLDIPGLFESRSGLRRGASLAFEIGANTLIDPLSVFDPTGTSQYAGGVLLNYIAQKIRGGEISAGELTAAGLSSLIPGGAQGRALIRFGKGAVKGAATGAIEATSVAAIDEGRLPTAGELGASAGFGAAFGGALSTPQAQKAFKAVAKKVDDASYDLTGALVRAGLSPEYATGQGAFIPAPRQSATPGAGEGGGGSDFGGDGGFFKRVVEKVMRNKRTAPSLFVDPVTLKPKRGFTQFEMASALDRYIDNLSKKSGYKSLADFKVQVLDELKEGDKLKLFQELQEGENLQTGYIEHMTAKASKKNRLERLRGQMPVLSMDEDYLASELSRRSQNSFDMDWYWSDTYIDKNGITRPALNKGDRDASKNVRINFNNRYKALKDVTENILYGTEAAPGIGTLSPKLENRLIVSVEDIDKRSFIFNRTQLGDIVIRRAGDNKLIGKIGNYLDVLYPQNNNARSLLESNVLRQINPDTGARFASLDEFRDHIIRKRIEIIVNDAPNLSRKSNKQRRLIIDKALQDDLIKLYEKYPFLPKPKYISEITNKGLDQNVGPFPTKTQQRKYIQGQLKGRLDE